MSSTKGPEHVIVDGSNIATEGRSMPSLAQLSEAVAGFMEEHPGTAVTVVVDATFGHRIDKSERSEFEAGIENNELVAPPAGAVGRGDAFVLGIADKSGASVLSNDSFQEFHGEYEWLFDEGRLIGGKPVPHVGWVWVDRVPVRGPVSRKATRGSGGSRRSGGGRSRRGSGASGRTASKEASGPMPTPTKPPPGRASSSKADAVDEAALDEATDDAIDDAADGSAGERGGGERSSRSERGSSGRSSSSGRSKSVPTGNDTVNDLMPFLEFVEQHPVGTEIDGVVDAYASHGAYVTLGDTGVRGYVPLRLMDDPAPRSAKQVMKLDETVSLVVVSFVADRRSIDCALPDMADDAIDESAEAQAVEEAELAAEVRAHPVDGGRSRSTERATPKEAAAKKSAAKKAATEKAAAKKAATKKAAAKKTATKKAATKKAATKKAAAKKAAAKKAAATSKSAAKRPASKRATAEAAATELAAVDDGAASEAAGETSSAIGDAVERAAVAPDPASAVVGEPAEEPTPAATKRSAVKKAASKKSAVKKAATKRSAVKKAATKKSAVKKAATKKSASKKAATEKAATKKAASKKAATTRTERAASTGDGDAS